MHRSIQMQGPQSRSYTKFSRSDDTIHAGITPVIDDKNQIYITTDRQTMNFLPSPDNATNIKLRAMSDDGLTIMATAVVDNIAIGYYWSEAKGIQLVKSTGAFINHFTRMSSNTQISGGWIKPELEKFRTAALLLNNEYLFVYSLAGSNQPSRS